MTIVAGKSLCRRRVDRGAVLIACLFTTLTIGLETACAGPAQRATRRSPVASNPVLRTTAVGGYPVGVITNSLAHRVFVFNAANANAVNGDSALLAGVDILDASTGASLHSVHLNGYMPLSYGVIAAATDPRTRRVFVLTSSTISPDYFPNGRGVLYVLDGATGAVVRRVSVGLGPRAVAANTHGGTILVSSADAVRVIDTRTNAVVRAIPSRAATMLVLNGITGGVPRGVSGVTTSAQEDIDAVAVDDRVGRILVDVRNGITRDDRVDVLVAATGRVAYRVNAVGGAPMVADAGSGHTFAASVPTGSSPGAVSINMLDTRSAHLLQTITLDLAVSPSEGVSIAVVQRREQVYVVVEDPLSSTSTSRGRFVVIDARSGTMRRDAISVGRGTWASRSTLAVDEVAGHAFVANMIDGTVTMLDMARL